MHKDALVSTSARPLPDPCREPRARAGALFVVARALEETRAVERLLLPALGRPRGHRSALLRLCLPVGLFSAFLNNTPIVAMLLPICEGWAARCNLSIKVRPYYGRGDIHGYTRSRWSPTPSMAGPYSSGYTDLGAAHAALLRVDARRHVHPHRHVDQPRAQRAGTTNSFLRTTL